jgi:hypothetical protein
VSLEKVRMREASSFVGWNRNDKGREKRRVTQKPRKSGTFCERLESMVGSFIRPCLPRAEGGWSRCIHGSRYAWGLGFQHPRWLPNSAVVQLLDSKGLSDLGPYKDIQLFKES